MAEKLAKLDINSTRNLIDHFPFRHQDFSLITSISKVQEGETVSLVGEISEIKNNYTRSPRQKTIQKAILRDQGGSATIVWFNQPYLVKNLAPPTVVSVSGKVRRQGSKLQLVSPDFEILDQGKKISSYGLGSKFTTNTGRLVPIYPTTFGITNKYLRSLMAKILPKVKNKIKEFLPAKIIIEQKLMPEKEAISKIHFPENKIALEKAKKRLAFDEMFLFQLNLFLAKKQWQKKLPAPPIKTNLSLWKKFISNLPFQLTKAQNRVAKEIFADLDKPTAMNRLLQGDVGSGKTVVAAAAILMTANSGYQSALMVPTEILAQQHYRNLTTLLKPFGIKTRIITSSTKKMVNDQRGVGNSQLIVGTHALIHKYAQFNRVGLVIIDEQHRFGVSQRTRLIKKAALADKDKLSPHILTMTATPIPRTISLTVYGDLDISTLDEMPPGRKPIKTYLIPNKKRSSCYQWIKKQIKPKTKNQKPKTQAFIICPLIEDSETLESVKSATVEYEHLKKSIFPDLRLGLLHGRMKSKEKQAVLAKTTNGKLDILIATPVVEVGIDIPTATIMIIETANRFGLAQLHQLRGRVGRGTQQAYCFLFAKKLSQKAKVRLKAMEEINNGMKLAEIDLKMRGPGEIYGLRQHGFPELKIASLADLELIQRTRKAAQKLITRDPSLATCPELKNRLQTINPHPIAPN